MDYFDQWTSGVCEEMAAGVSEEGISADVCEKIAGVGEEDVEAAPGVVKSSNVVETALVEELSTGC